MDEINNVNNKETKYTPAKLKLNKNDECNITNQSDISITKDKTDIYMHKDNLFSNIKNKSPIENSINKVNYKSNAENNLRKDFYGTDIIKKEKNKTHKVSFIDQIDFTQNIAIIIEIENYKKYNNEEIDFHAETIRQPRLRVDFDRKIKSEDAKTDCHCCKAQ